MKLKLEIKIHLKEETCVSDTVSARKAWFVTSTPAYRTDVFHTGERTTRLFCRLNFHRTSAQNKRFLSSAKESKRKNEHKRKKKKIKSQTVSDKKTLSYYYSSVNF